MTGDHKLCGERCPRPSSWLKQAGETLVAVIREVFDESAYQRFLSRAQLPSSPQAYAAFRREDEVLKTRRPRCC